MIAQIHEKFVNVSNHLLQSKWPVNVTVEFLVVSPGHNLSDYEHE